MSWFDKLLIAVANQKVRYNQIVLTSVIGGSRYTRRNYWASIWFNLVIYPSHAIAPPSSRYFLMEWVEPTAREEDAIDTGYV